ncbi:unnamed protein product, partial [Iphiclides podalirius]
MLPATIVDGDLNERFVWPYLKSFGGAVAILGKQYKNINGMSNKFFGVCDNLVNRNQSSQKKEWQRMD